MANVKKFASEPRDYALEMVENGLVTADHLLLCCLKYMSHDGVDVELLSDYDTATAGSPINTKADMLAACKE